MQPSQETQEPLNELKIWEISENIFDAKQATQPAVKSTNILEI